MTVRRTIELPLDLIDVGERLRPIDQAHVEQLAESMDRRGLDTPITVREPDAEGRHRLTAGGHRLAAARKLGWRKIDAFVVPADDDTARLIEIEENLVRHDLSELDRAVFLAKWKELYTQLTAARGRGRPSEKKGANSPQLMLPFSAAVHQRLRMHPRNVNKAVARAGLAPELRAALAGHPAADNGSVLDLLTKLSLDDQRDLAGNLTLQLSVGDVRRRAGGIMGKGAPKPVDYAAKIIALWDKCSADQKAQVRRYIAPRSGRPDA